MQKLLLPLIFTLTITSCANNQDGTTNEIKPIELTSLEANAVDSALKPGNGKGSDSGNDASGTDSNSNTPPSITGTPQIQVNVNETYSYKVVASDIDGDRLRFNSKNKPSWLTFNKRHGKLSGIPDTSNSGNFANITISVTDGFQSTSLPPFSIEVIQTTPAASANLSPEITGSPILQ